MRERKRLFHFFLLLFLLLVRTCFADFDSNSIQVAVADLEQSMNPPVLTSNIILDGFQSRFLFNKSSVDFSSLSSLLFADIRKLQSFGSYYHLWVGFEDGAFLGFYDKGSFEEIPRNLFAISYMSSSMHDCSSQYNISAPCREYFTADNETGTMTLSFKGAQYDPRTRAWYFKTAGRTTAFRIRHPGNWTSPNDDVETPEAQWTSMYVDKSLGEPAFAFCVPLLDLTSSLAAIAATKVDQRTGLIGVVCTGLLIEDISRSIAASFTDASDKMVFVRDHENILVASSARDRGSYYNASVAKRIETARSPDALISWAARQLMNSTGDNSWPEDGTNIVRWVQESRFSSNEVIGGTAIKQGDAYFISTQAYNGIGSGIDWDIIVVQRVDCPVGYEVDTEKLVCIECVSPAMSDGGASSCNLCVQGYYFSKSRGKCRQCPRNAICAGRAALPRPKVGFWMDPTKEQLLEKDGMCCSRSYSDGGHCVVDKQEPNCKGGGINESYSWCFSSPKNLQTCRKIGITENDILCKNGATGKLCSICEISKGYYYDGSKCADCSGNILPLILFIIFGSIMLIIGLCIYIYYGEFITANAPLIVAALFDTGRAKVFYANSQIIGSIASSTGIIWPSPFSFFAKVFAITELNFFDVLPLECVNSDMNFYGYAITVTLGPVAVCVMLYMIMTNKALLRRSARRPSGPRELRRRIRGYQKIKFFIDPGFVWKNILLILYIFLPTGNLALVRTLKCTEFPDGSSWLSADLSLQCRDASGEMRIAHALMVTYASIMLLVYGPGIPFFFWSLLYKNREAIKEYDKQQDTMECPEALKPLKFLFFHFKPEVYNTEWKECIRRLLCTGGVALFPRERGENALFGMLLTVLFSIWQREQSPWEEPSTNALALAFAWIVYFCFFGAFVILVGQKYVVLTNDCISWLLLLICIGIFIMALRQQSIDFKRNKELITLKGEVAAFRQQVVRLAYCRRSMQAHERHRFLFSDWAMRPIDMTIEQRMDLAQQTSVDTSHFRSDEEVVDFIEMQQRFDTTGNQVDWYWQEDLTRKSTWDTDVIYPDHELEKKEGKIWIKYSQAVSAQLEKRHVQLVAGEAADPIISVDLEGRVVGTGNLQGNNGLKYSVDCGAKIQTNARTGFKRPCLRVETAIERGRLGKGKKTNNSKDPGAIGNININSLTSKDAPGTPVTLNAERLDKREIRDKDMPLFPLDLIEAGEPMLLIQKGQLVQIQKKREDGWMFGSVVWKSANIADLSLENRSLSISSLVRPKGLKVVPVENNAPGESSNTPAFTKKNDNSRFGAGIDAVEWEVTNSRSNAHGMEDLGGETSGWFPSIFVRPPQMSELKEMQEALGGSEKAIDALAVPDSWSENSKKGLSTDAKLIPLNPKSEEYDKVAGEFLKRLSNRHDMKRVKVEASRIENLGLWQSYAAKRATLLLRAENEGCGDRARRNYEKLMMFHGTHPDVVSKIMQQGFNRMFCGKNAVRFGKGVYFALTSAYSNNYAMADAKGVKRMFICRVLVGETSQGYNEQLVPEIRVLSTNQMFDSTTDQIDSPEPDDNDPARYGSGVRQMYVTYHDAQAYPEYLLEYSFVE